MMPDMIAGDYEFGDQPPEQLMGWLGYEEESRAYEQVQALGLAFDFSEVKHRVIGAEPMKARVFTWDIERRLHAEGKLPFELIPTPRQDTGNCVGEGLKCTGQKRQILEMRLEYQEEEYHEWYTPWIYAISRNQIGGGMSGAGSTGVWGARAVNEYGVLFADDEGVPPYAGYSDRWGHRRNAGNIKRAEYGKFAGVATDNKIKIVRCRTVDEMHKMIRAGTTLTIASWRGFRMAPREIKGHHVFVPSGGWSHQMHFTDEITDPISALYRGNQWGKNAHGTPLNGETPGGAWNLDDDIEDEMDRGGVVVYGYFDFAGEPGEPDHEIL